ncbi:MAG: fibronectin type III domain-containing protein [Bacteroidota bacterium]
MPRILRIPLLALAVAWLVPIAPSASAQPLDAIRVAVQEAGAVYLYHTRIVPLGYGMEVYRAQRGEEVKLTAEPLRAAGDELEFRGRIPAEVYERLQAEVGPSVLFRLRADPVLGGVQSFLEPDIARGLARLFVDSTAVIGQEATYRMAFVDIYGVPTGDELTVTTLLSPNRVAPPPSATATHDEEAVTLTWTYAPTTRQTDDKVIAFTVDRLTPNGPVRVHGDPILRRNDTDTFTLNVPIVARGQTEQFAIRAIDIAEQASAPAEVQVTLADRFPPATLFNVEAALDGDVPVVTWPISLDPDASLYRVYRTQTIADTTSFRLVSTVEDVLGTVYRDTEVQGTGVYYYTVTVVDGAGNESKRSNAAVVQRFDQTAPPAPTQLVARSDGRAVGLSWMGTLSEDFLTYAVLRKRPADPAFSRINVDALRANRYRDAGLDGSGLAEGQRYRYAVVAIDSTRNISDSTFADVTIPRLVALPAPSTVQVTNDAGQRLVVRWSSVPEVGLEGYVVYRDADDLSTTLDTLSQQQTQFTDRDVRPGVTYRYRIASLADGVVSVPTASAPTLMRDRSPPGTVRNVRATEATLRWEPVRAADLAGYRLYRADIATGVYALVADELVAGVEAAAPQAGWYQICAVDTSGNESRPSKAVRVR